MIMHVDADVVDDNVDDNLDDDVDDNVVDGVDDNVDDNADADVDDNVDADVIDNNVADDVDNDGHGEAKGMINNKIVINIIANYRVTITACFYIGKAEY